MRTTEYEWDGCRPLIESARNAANEVASALAGRSLPHDALPGYRILREVHRGGQGVVYRAVRLATGREVAVKVMRDGPFSGPRDIARFEREVQILAQLSHPNIVGIHDRGRSRGCHYFVMDYVAGQTLDAYVDQRQPSIPDRLELFLKIGRAVNAAHLRGVIHRDLKPSNVRIDADGEPHVLDFGLAKITMEETEEGAVGRSMTLTGQFVGTLPWASPEQAEGSADRVDLRSDVYSLGVILYYMLTGGFPYPVAGTPRKVLGHILESTPIRPRTLGKAIDEDVETIVLKCLAKEPERRYQSMAAVIEDIERYLNRQPILARSPSTMYQLRTFARRNRGLVIGVVAVFCTLVLGLAGTAWQAHRAREEAVRAANKSEESEAIREFLVQDLLASAMPEFARGRKVTVEEVLANASKRVDAAFRNRPEIEASIRMTLGQVYQSLGLYGEAEAHLREAVSVSANMRGELDEETLRLRHLWIQAGMELGPAWDSAGATQSFLKDCRASIGDAHELTAWAGLWNAKAAHSDGETALAFERMRSAYDHSRRYLGEEHQVTQEIGKRFAGWTFRRSAQRADWESLFREQFESYRSELGPDHPATLQAATMLGLGLMEQRRFAEAEPLLRGAEASLRHVLGERHPGRLPAMRSLGLLLTERGHAREALELAREALDLGRAVLGEEHPVTLDALRNQAVAYFRSDCHAEAARTLEVQWETMQRLYGESSDHALEALDLYSFSLLNLGHHETAELGLRRSHELRSTRPDGVSSSDAWNLRQLVRSLSEQGRSEEAREFGVKLLDLRRNEALRPDADAYALNSYAFDLLTVKPEDLRDPEEALRFARAAYEKSGEEYHFNRYTLALAHEANGQLDEAVAFARRALSVSPLEDTTERRDYESLISGCLERSHNLEGAEQVYRDSLAARRERSPLNYYDVSASLFDLGTILLKHGKPAEAEPLLRECLQIREDLLAHPTAETCTLTLGSNIVRTRLALGKCLMELERYAEAEALILESLSIDGPPGDNGEPLSKEGLQNAIDLYDVWGKPDQATKFRAQLQSY